MQWFFEFYTRIIILKMQIRKIYETLFIVSFANKMKGNGSLHFYLVVKGYVARKVSLIKQRRGTHVTCNT